MAKKDKSTVLVGFNAPDPTGARNEKGDPKEVRFEVGAEITAADVLPASLKTLLEVKAVRPSGAEPDQEAPPASA
jgi:hypothetical protein